METEWCFTYLLGYVDRNLVQIQIKTTHMLQLTKYYWVKESQFTGIQSLFTQQIYFDNLSGYSNQSSSRKLTVLVHYAWYWCL